MSEQQAAGVHRWIAAVLALLAVALVVKGIAARGDLTPQECADAGLSGRAPPPVAAPLVG